jgi:putative transposase
MRIAYKYKAKVNDKTLKNLEHCIYLSRFLWNCMIEHRQKVFEMTRKLTGEGKKGKKKTEIAKWDYVFINGYAQKKELPEIKKIFPEYKKYPSNIFQDTCRKLDKAYNAVFRNGFGFPQYRNRKNFNSISMSYANGYSMNGKSAKTLHDSGFRPDHEILTVSGIGRFKLLAYDKNPIRGRIKQVHLLIKNNTVWVVFSCDEAEPKMKPVNRDGKIIGIDLGVTQFFSDSEGFQTAMPENLKQAIEKKKLIQKKIGDTKGKKISNNKRRLYDWLAKQEEHIANIRKHFHHEMSMKLVRENDIIFAESLNIKGLTKSAAGTIEEHGKNVAAKSGLNREILNCGWGNFLLMLESKCEKYGKRLIYVDPKNTSQNCSQCGSKVKKSLSVRVHDCPVCGLIEDRDVNAAKNILQRGMESLDSVGSDTLPSFETK